MNLWAILGIILALSAASGTIYYKGYQSCNAAQTKEVFNETKKQANILITHGTDDDTYALLMRKATDERKLESKGDK